MLVSVIVPVYNEKDYIDEFICSIVQQDFAEYEVILIDDGSTDGTRQILSGYENQYEFVKVIYANHGGVSSARNLGIDVATGKYLLFLDSDDYAYSNMIQKLYQEIEEKDCDFVVCNALRQRDNEWYKQCEDEAPISIDLQQYGREHYLIDYVFSEKHKYCLWNKMFRRDHIIAHNIKFISNEQIYPEDLLFLFDVILWSKRIVWIPEVLYKHFIRPASITSSYRVNIYDRYYQSLLHMKNQIQDFGVLKYITIDLLCNAFTASIKSNRCGLKKTYQELKDHYQDYITVIPTKRELIHLPRNRIFFEWCVRRNRILLPSIVFYFMIKYKIRTKL